MTKTDKHRNGVIGIVNRARRFNPDIGIYQEHFYSDDFRFIVRLSNGRMKFPDEYAHDQETMPSSISDEIIEKIAKTFRNI